MSLAQGYDFVVQWHLTERCNLRCRHCYQEGGKHPEMPLQAIKGVIGEIAAMLAAWQEAYEIEFSPSFNVTGGEPFLRADFPEVLAELARANFDCFVLSNGTLIGPGEAELMRSLAVRGVQVSLEGPEEIHEQIRGRGSFQAALQGIRHLLAAGVAVSINATLSRFNAEAFYDLVRLASELKVPRLGFSRLVPAGQGAGMLGEMLSAAEVRELYEKIFALRVEGLAIVTGDPVAVQLREPAGTDDLGDTPAGGCAAGVAGLTILPDGTLTPCRRLPIPLGQAGRDSIREIWAVSPVLEQLRDRSRYRGKCRTCRRWSACRGCRAIAYAYAQAQGEPDVLAEDPQCFIER
jgi:AdoMet-dependent heme synthase